MRVLYQDVYVVSYSYVARIPDSSANPERKLVDVVVQQDAKKLA
jgi:hypothetical protein